MFSGIKRFVIALLITILTVVIALWVHAGTPTTNEAIKAIAPDPAVIGLSILSGAHMHICPRVMELLKERGLDDVLVLVGGFLLRVVIVLSSESI